MTLIVNHFILLFSNVMPLKKCLQPDLLQILMCVLLSLVKVRYLKMLPSGI